MKLVPCESDSSFKSCCPCKQIGKWQYLAANFNYFLLSVAMISFKACYRDHQDCHCQYYTHFLQSRKDNSNPRLLLWPLYSQSRAKSQFTASELQPDAESGISGGLNGWTEEGFVTQFPMTANNLPSQPGITCAKPSHDDFWGEILHLLFPQSFSQPFHSSYTQDALHPTLLTVSNVFWALGWPVTCAL